MSRFRSVARFLYVASLAAFLVWGVSERLVRGPLENGQARLGFAASLATPLPKSPPCLIRGEVGRGATLLQVLDREGLPKEDARPFLIQLASLTDVRHVEPEDEYRLFADPLGRLIRLEYQPNPAGYFVVEKGDQGLRAWKEDEPLTRVERKVTGTVRGSLHASLLASDVDAELAATFCDVFSCEVDFATETRDGDGFEFLVEETQKDGRRIMPARLIGGSYQHGGRTFEAVYFEGRNGRGGFYGPNGESLRKAFLKSPLDYTCISSHFTNCRLHPIFKTDRPHHGVDYAAPAGTPVVSVARGTVVFKEWMSGYGNLVKIDHAGGITTYYAHLSRFGKGLRKGSKVDQNQVIGYVGQTGHATGPHLDYRIEQAGRFIDPLRFKSSAGEPLDAAERQGFEEKLEAYRRAMKSSDPELTASLRAG